MLSPTETDVLALKPRQRLRMAELALAGWRFSRVEERFDAVVYWRALTPVSGGKNYVAISLHGLLKLVTIDELKDYEWVDQT